MTGLLGQVVMQRHAREVPAVRIGTVRLIESALEMLLAGLRPGPAGARTPRAPGRARREGNDS